MGLEGPSKLVGCFRQTVGEIVRHLLRFILVEPMRGDELGEIGAIDTARHIVPGGDGAERRGCRR